MSNPTVKLLLDEAHDGGSADITTWSSSPRPLATTASTGRRSGSMARVCLFSLCALIAGLIIGALLTAWFFPQGVYMLLPSSSGVSNSPFTAWFFDDDGDTDESSKEVEEISPQCEAFPWSEPRLPRSLAPVTYNITLHPNITTTHMSGSVAIDFEVLETTSLVVLHAERLNLSSQHITINGEETPAEFAECESYSLWSFTLSKPVHPGDSLQLGLVYEGLVLPDMRGLYITTHTTVKGKILKSAVTQFEPAYARRVFPSMDEPDRKATFQLSVVREAHHVSRSNMPLEVTREFDQDRGLYLDVFRPSVRMSTYLLAVGILDEYDYIRRNTKHTSKPIEVRLYAPKDTIEGQAEFGLDTGIRALEYFENYFNISYPLDKQDLLALDDFSEGAMENWGLVTFRDTALMYSNSSNVMSKEHIALVICHEIAHQWFGNLVTMGWWDELWLNEGFANYMEYKCVDHLFPDWRVMTRFYSENVAHSQELDGLSSSRPVYGNFTLTHNTNFMSLFDAISYHKSASIIHMILTLSGEKQFQRALIEYLNKYAYGNAKGEQLWEIVGKHASLPNGVTVESLANAFIKQVGYPVVRVGLHRGDAIAYNQTRFLVRSSGEDSRQWPLPVHYRSDKSHDDQLKWIMAGEQNVTWHVDSGAKWIIANTGGVGYFKVLYDDNIYRALIKQLKKDHTKISSIDRAMLLHDAFEFTKAGLLPIGTYMGLVEYAYAESDRMTRAALNQQLRYIEYMIEDRTDLSRLFKDFEKSLLVKIYDNVGWKSNASATPLQKGLQEGVLSQACRVGYGDCRKKAVAMFNEWSKNKKTIPPELKTLVLEYGVKGGDDATWNRAFSAYASSESPTEKQTLLAALAATKDQKLVTHLLNLALESSSFRPNMVPRLLTVFSGNHVSRNNAWRFFKVNYDKFVEILGESSNLLTISIRAIVETMSTEQDVKELKEFLAEKKLDSHPKLAQVFDKLSLNVEWRSVNEASVGEWLHEWDERRSNVRGRRRRKH